MTTLTSSALPIPDSVVVGSGSYTVPASRYGFIQMNTTSTFYKSGQTNSTTYQGQGSGVGISGTANSGQQWITAGTSISNASNLPTVSHASDGNTGSTLGAFGYSAIRINGTDACMAYCGHIATAYGTWSRTIANSTGSAGWTISLYRIPKGNLPTGAAEGE